MKRLIKTNFNVDAAKSFINSVKYDSSYYMFAANSGESEPNINMPVDSKSADVSLYDSMLFGKRVKFDDIKLCTKRYDWKEKEVYDMYDDLIDLTDKRYYVMVKSGLGFKVYKCLFNNGGAESLVEPFGTSTEPFETMDDGYVWKYMYEISSFYTTRFINNTNIPVFEQEEVISSAKPGTIDIIKVEDAGLGYSNWTVGRFVQNSDLRVSGDPKVYALAGDASSRVGFYKNCIIKISSTGTSNGQFRKIVDYQVLNGRKLITIDEPFTVTPSADDSYEIYPNAFVNDLSNTSTEECVARAIVNPNQANSISRVEVLSSGLNYRSAEVKLLPDPSVGVSDERSAHLRAIIAPSNGHGSDPFNELKAYFVGISSSFTGNSAPIVAENTFKTIGLLKQPKFSECTLTLDTDSVRGTFIPGEQLFRYRPVHLQGKVEVFSNSLVVGVGTTFLNSIKESESILITNGLTNIFANAIIIDDTNLKLDVEPSFIGSNCDIYLASLESFASCVDYDSPLLKITNVLPTGFSVSQNIFGGSSKATSKVSSEVAYLTIGTRDFDDFSAFNQLTRLDGLLITDSEFVENEVLNQESLDTISPSATFHSYFRNEESQFDSVYVTNKVKEFQVPGLIQSDRAEATQTLFEITNKYNGEIIPDSGEILYVENFSAISRNDAQTEVIKLFLEF